MQIRKGLWTVLVTLCLFFCACKPGTISLQFNPAHNSSYGLDFRMDGKVNISLAGNDMATRMGAALRSHFTIDSVAQDGYLLQLTYDEYDLRQQVAGKEIDFSINGLDSTTKSQKAGDLLKGFQIATKVSKQGVVGEIEDNGEFIKRLDSSLQGMPDTLRLKLMASIESMVNNDMARGMLEQCFSIFPKEKVNVGDSWKNEIKMQSMFSMVMKNTYTLVGVKDGVAELSLRSKISPASPNVLLPGMAMANHPSMGGASAEKKGFNIMDIKMTAEFNGEQEGSLWVDMATGVLQKSRIKQKLEGEIGVSLFKLPMKMDMESGYDVRPQ